MNYTLKVNGNAVPLAETTVFPPPYNHTEKMPFAVVVNEGPIDLELTSEAAVESVVIRPQRLGLKADFDAHTIRFHMDKPEKVSVEINGSYKNNIVIWASAPRDNALDLSGKVIRYAAGETSLADLPDGQLVISEDNTVLYLEKGAVVHGRVLFRDCKNITVFLDEDAVVHGRIHAENVENLKVCGFGAICAEGYDRNEDTVHTMDLRRCKNVEVFDICLLDSVSWTLRVFGCDDVHIDNINIAGCRGNSDGVDICGSRNVLAERCFIRNWDDGFVAKAFDTGDLENVVCRNSTIWNDFARPIEVGVEVRADNARNLRFENIDIIHSVTGYPLMGIHHGDHARLRDIVFENIRIEDAPGAQIFDIRITNSVWNEDKVMGDIDGLLIKDIYLNGEQPILPSRSRLQGFDEEHMIRNVTMENICFNGKFATTIDECMVNVMDFVEGVQVKYPEDGVQMKMVKTAVNVSEPFTVGEDGLYHGVVELVLENRNDVAVTGKAQLQVSPVNTAEIPDNAFTYDIPAGGKLVRPYALTLQPGKYVFCIQSTDPAVEASWHYEVLRLPLAACIDCAPAYKIINYYGDCLEGVRLAAANDKLILRSDALKTNTFTVYSAAPVAARPGEVMFTVEETDFGEAMAIMDGRHGLEAAPQLRCPGEITYVFENEPKVKEIVKNVVGGEGCDTVEIDFAKLGVENGSKEIWLEVVADLPEVRKYRYAFSMFHSVLPGDMAHMFARADVK